MNVLSRLTPEQRAAVVLVSLQPEQAQPLAELLGITAMRRIQGALAGLSHISEEEVLAAFADFIAQLTQWRSGLRGGEAESFDLLTKALGDALVDKIRVIPRAANDDLDTWGKAGQLEPEVTGEYLGQQHPTVAALILDRLPPDRVPEVLANMPSERAVDAIGQMSQPGEPAPAAISIAEKMVEQDLLGANVDLSTDPKIAMIGETLGTLPSALREAAIAKLEEVDDVRAAAIKASLLKIEDLPLRLPTKSVQVIFRDVGRDILIRGLKALDENTPEVSTFLLGNIAQRMADKYREEVEAMPEMSAPEKDRAIGNMVREVLGLSRRGAIALIPMSEIEGV
jgi:flagellar motor switch protein FliG